MGVVTLGTFVADYQSSVEKNRSYIISSSIMVDHKICSDHRLIGILRSHLLIFQSLSQARLKKEEGEK
jgi:hypothetical protein